MAEFLSNLDIELVSETEWRLTAPLAYQSDIVGRIVVPLGFVTDLATVPRVPLVYWFWGSRAHREAVVHDYLCRIGSVPDVSYTETNMVFFEAMTARNKPWYIKYPMYWGVCIGCWPLFKKRPVVEC